MLNFKIAIQNILYNFTTIQLLLFVAVIGLWNLSEYVFNLEIPPIIMCAPKQTVDLDLSLKILKQLAERFALEDPNIVIDEITKLPEKDQERAYLMLNLIKCVHIHRYRINSQKDLYKYCHFILRALKQVGQKTKK